MGRSIIAEEYVEKYIEKLLKENKWYIGVIIGQVRKCIHEPCYEGKYEHTVYILRLE